MNIISFEINFNLHEVPSYCIYSLCFHLMLDNIIIIIIICSIVTNLFEWCRTSEGDGPADKMESTICFRGDI